MPSSVPGMPPGGVPHHGHTIYTTSTAVTPDYSERPPYRTLLQQVVDYCHRPAADDRSALLLTRAVERLKYELRDTEADERACWEILRGIWLYWCEQRGGPGGEEVLALEDCGWWLLFAVAGAVEGGSPMVATQASHASHTAPPPPQRPGRRAA